MNLTLFMPGFLSLPSHHLPNACHHRGWCSPQHHPWIRSWKLAPTSWWEVSTGFPTCCSPSGLSPPASDPASLSASQTTERLVTSHPPNASPHPQPSAIHILPEPRHRGRQWLRLMVRSHRSLEHLCLFTRAKLFTLYSFNFLRQTSPEQTHRHKIHWFQKEVSFYRSLSL